MLSLVGGSSILFRTPIASSSSKLWSKFSYSVARCCSLQPPDVAQLADTARITLSPKEVEDFAPKIRQVIDWFGQLQAVDLQSVEPSLRADAELSVNPRDDVPEEFSNREAILEQIPSFTDPYIKVPKVLNKE